MMAVLQRLRKYLYGHILPNKVVPPETAYNSWSATYDNQPDNLILALDETIFSAMLNDISISDRIILDIGCGTGRHWEKLLAKHPQRLIGFDVSSGMLKKLKQKFPDAETYHFAGATLQGINDSSCDLVISTLTLAHIEDLEDAMNEWNRVLKAGGDIIITDYHPEAIARGAKRTFYHNDKLIAVKNYLHPIEKIRVIANRLRWHELTFKERVIDESIKNFYEKKQALTLYDRFTGMPIIYGIHLRRSDVAY